MRKVIYLDRAKRDLRQIADFIAERAGDPEPAIKFTKLLQQQCRKLASIGPMMGRSRPELGPAIRSFPFRNYLIFLRYEDSRLEIVALRHMRQDSEAAFGDGDGF